MLNAPLMSMEPMPPSAPAPTAVVAGRKSKNVQKATQDSILFNDGMEYCHLTDGAQAVPEEAFASASTFDSTFELGRARNSVQLYHWLLALLAFNVAMDIVSVGALCGETDVGWLYSMPDFQFYFPTNSSADFPVAGVQVVPNTGPMLDMHGTRLERGQIVKVRAAGACSMHLCPAGGMNLNARGDGARVSAGGRERRTKKCLPVITRATVPPPPPPLRWPVRRSWVKRGHRYTQVDTRTLGPCG